MNTIGNILCFLWAFLIALFAIPSVRNMAFKKRLLDEPNLRSSHELSTPRLGGLAIFAGFLSAITLFGNIMDRATQSMISGAILLFFIGLKDDISPVSPVKKFFIQILSTSIVMFIGNLKITSFQGIFGVEQLNDGVSYLFSAIVIIGVTNSINLIDGLDGLAGTVIMFVCFAMSFFFFFAGIQPLVALALCLAGSTLGFLRYNFHKADIFMGDSGSLTCGFILSFLTINFIETKPINSSIAMAVAILFIPILDTTRVFGLRVLNGQSPFIPDKNHIHHVLLRYGFNAKIIVASLIFINLLLVLTIGYFNYLGNTILVSIEIVLAFLIVVFLKVFEK